MDKNGNKLFQFGDGDKINFRFLVKNDKNVYHVDSTLLLYDIYMYNQIITSPPSSDEFTFIFTILCYKNYLTSPPSSSFYSLLLSCLFCLISSHLI